MFSLNNSPNSSCLHSKSRYPQASDTASTIVSGRDIILEAYVKIRIASMKFQFGGDFIVHKKQTRVSEIACYVCSNVVKDCKNILKYSHTKFANLVLYLLP